VATDLSPAALAVAERNARAHGVADRIRFAAGDGFAPVAGERFDTVLANPPYVAERDAATLAPELRHEPPGALFAGPDGTDLLRRLAAALPAHLAPGGRAGFEVGLGQADAAAGWLRAAGLANVSVRRDLAGRPRIVVGRLGDGATD
jgi:release factor glutamine methyltransferase